MTDFGNFVGRAKRLEDIDLPRIARTIGVGEDELHAFMDVESRGKGFDSQRRPIILFEPHVFYRNLSGPKLTKAIGEGLAYKKWGTRPYPADSYPRLRAAMAIDETAALCSASWGLAQILGENHQVCGYASVQEMVLDFMNDEANHLEAAIKFIVASGIDDELRYLASLKRPTMPNDCVGFVSVYNGPGYKKNRYHIKFADAHNKWRGIKDTPYNPDTGEAPSINVPQVTGTTATIGLILSAYAPWIGFGLLSLAAITFIGWKLYVRRRSKNGS